MIELGGRPSRAIRSKPDCQTTVIDGVPYSRREDDTQWIEEDEAMYDYWTAESNLFEDELNRWKSFRAWQRRSPKQDSPLNPSDLRDLGRSTKALVARINDWRQYESYHNHYVRHLRKQKVRCRRALEKAIQLGAETRNECAVSDYQSDLDVELHEMQKAQARLGDAEERLTWVRDQTPQILRETLDSKDFSLTAS